MPEPLTTWEMRNLSCSIRNTAKDKGLLAKFNPDGSWRLYRGTQLVSSGDGLEYADALGWLMEQPDQPESATCPTCGQTQA